MTAESLTYSGPHYNYEKVPIALRPLQQPHPAFWYGSSNTTGSTWAGEHGLHFVTLGPVPIAKANIEAFKEAFAKRGRAAQPKAEFPGGAAIGVQRHIFVADTDAQAKRFAKPAMEVHLANLNWLRNMHGVTGLTSRLNVARGADYEACVADGTVISGNPETVRAEIERQVRGARRELPAHLPVSRHDDAQRRAAIAAAVLNRGNAEDRASLTGSAGPLHRTVRNSGSATARGNTP